MLNHIILPEMLIIIAKRHIPWFTSSPYETSANWYIWLPCNLTWLIMCDLTWLIVCDLTWLIMCDLTWLIMWDLTWLIMCDLTWFCSGWSNHRRSSELRSSRWSGLNPEEGNPGDRTRSRILLLARAASSFVLLEYKAFSSFPRRGMISSPGDIRRFWNFRIWKSHNITITSGKLSTCWNTETENLFFAYCFIVSKYYVFCSIGWL